MVGMLQCLCVCVFTQAGVVLSHLDFLHTLGREPAGPAFNAAFPESSFTDGQNCTHTVNTASHTLQQQQ